MTWHISESLRCLLEPVGGSSVASCLDGEQSAPSKSSPTAAKSSCVGKTKGTSKRSPYGTTCEHLTELSGAEKWMSSLADSPARTFPLQAKATGSTASEADSGQKWPVSLAKYDPASRSWKIPQCLFGEGLTRSSRTWPNWGMVAGGECWALTPLDILITEPDCGWLPTPSGVPGPSNHMVGRLDEWGGSANPWRKTEIGRYFWSELEEAVMGFPLEWTALEPYGTVRFQQWQQQHGAFLEGHDSV